MTISDKKITLPLDSHLSLIPFHLIFLDPFFTLFDAHRKVHANHEDGWSPQENLYRPCALNYEAFESCTSL